MFDRICRIFLNKFSQIALKAFSEGELVRHLHVSGHLPRGHRFIVHRHSRFVDGLKTVFQGNDFHIQVSGQPVGELLSHGLAHLEHLGEVAFVERVGAGVVTHQLGQDPRNGVVEHEVSAHGAAACAAGHDFAPQPTLFLKFLHDSFEAAATDAGFFLHATLRIVETFVVKHVALFHQQPVEEHHFVGWEQIVLQANDVDTHGGLDFFGRSGRSSDFCHVFQGIRRRFRREIESAACFSIKLLRGVGAKIRHLSNIPTSTVFFVRRKRHFLSAGITTSGYFVAGTGR